VGLLSCLVLTLTYLPDTCFWERLRLRFLFDWQLFYLTSLLYEVSSNSSISILPIVIMGGEREPSSRVVDVKRGVASTSIPPPQQITAHLTLQPPLSRRGHGPGLILVVDHYALLEPRDGCLDPPPIVKWAEEGFAVAQVLVPGKVDDGGEFPLARAVEGLRGMRECDCDGDEGFGVVCR
jgi:hypothetical protein